MKYLFDSNIIIMTVLGIGEERFSGVWLAARRAIS